MTRRGECEFVLAAVILGVCVGAREVMERDPVSHILIQLPLLALAGFFVANALGMYDELSKFCKTHAISGLLVVAFATAYWMLPRNIDAALQSPVVEWAKFITVPLLVGFPLALFWRHLPSLLRGFVKANAVSMLGVLAFLFTHAPIRICNSYLVSDQERLGFGFLYVALALAVLWSAPSVAGWPVKTTRNLEALGEPNP